MSKNELILQVHTKLNIRDVFYAKQFVHLMNNANIQWDRISDTEPVRNEYSDQRFYEYWKNVCKTGSKGQPPVYYAYVLCKRKDRKLSLVTKWSTKESIFSLHIQYSYMKREYAAINELLVQLIELLHPEAAYISNYQYWLHFPPNTMSKAIPAKDRVFWITYFSRRKFFEQKEKMLTGCDYSIKECASGVILFLKNQIPKDSDPIDDLCTSLFLVDKEQFESAEKVTFSKDTGTVRDR